jgi:leucyl aminopeptidase
VTAPIELSVDTAPFERIEADLAVAGFFLDERPLRGAAGRADWRLCGLVTDLVGEGRLRGKVGEATLIPSMGRLGAERVLLLGLGRRSAFRAGRARDASHAAVSRGLALGAESVVVAFPTDGPEAFATHASGFVRGAIEAAREADLQSRGGLRLCVAMAPGQAKQGAESLARAAAADEDGAVDWWGIVAR